MQGIVIFATRVQCYLYGQERTSQTYALPDERKKLPSHRVEGVCRASETCASVGGRTAG